MRQAGSSAKCLKGVFECSLGNATWRPLTQVGRALESTGSVCLVAWGLHKHYRYPGAFFVGERLSATLRASGSSLPPSLPPRFPSGLWV